MQRLKSGGRWADRAQVGLTMSSANVASTRVPMRMLGTATAVLPNTAVWPS